ncbi:XRE family transcriptional regulator [Vibrio artabrorum]|uniref:XRE family transcriptional regulator n=1 Tax=Vibrio artabrorum TaxID=446374 RepID=UPI00354B10FD
MDNKTANQKSKRKTQQNSIKSNKTKLRVGLEDLKIRDMSNISNKIKNKRKLIGLTQAELADLLQVKPQAVSGWERAINAPKGKQLINLSKALKVSKEWLLNGEESQETQSINSVAMVPFYPEVFAAAGCGYENEDPNSLTYPLPFDVFNKESNKSDVFCITSRGDSMEPAFYDGSILAINGSKKEIIEGRIYVFRTKTILRVKLIRVSNEGVILKSYNSNYPDELISWDDMENEDLFTIIGEVFWFSSKLNN